MVLCNWKEEVISIGVSLPSKKINFQHKSFDIMDGIETTLYSPSLLNPKSFLKGPFLHGDATRQFEYHNFSLMSLSPLV